MKDLIKDLLVLTLFLLAVIPHLVLAQPVAVETELRVETYTKGNDTQYFKIVTVENENEFACTDSNTTFEYDIDWIEDIECGDSDFSNYSNLLYRAADSAYESNKQLADVVNSTFRTCLSESNACQTKLTESTTQMSACRERIAEMYEVSEYEEVYANYTTVANLYRQEGKDKNTYILIAFAAGAAASYYYFKRKFAIDPDSEGLGLEEVF